MAYKYNPFTGEFDRVIGPGEGMAATSFETDAGTATPDGTGKITVIGGEAIDTSAAGSTITIAAEDASTTNKGVLETSTDAESIAGSSSTVAVVPTSLKAKLGVQTANAIPYGQGDSLAIGWTSALTNGQLAIGSTGVAPVAATLTAGPGIAITNGAGSISIQLVGGGVGFDSITPDSGTSPVVADGAGNVNVVGDGSTTTVGTGASTMSVQLTGLTNHAVLVGAGTTTITKVGPTATAGQVLQSAGGAADPAFSTATYPLTTTINQLLYSSAANTVGGLATANRAVITTGATGIPVATALATDGQLIIGSTAGAPAAATLTAGAGISVVNGSNSITINATGSGMAWENVTDATKAMVVNTGYFADRALGVTFTLPDTAALGSSVIITGIQGSWTLAQNAGETIYFGTSATTTGIGGSLASTDDEDCVELVCRVANTDWQVLSVQGNITVV